MSDTVIKVEGLGKRFRIHHQRPERYTTLRDTLARPFTRLFKPKPAIPSPQSSDEDFWALQDVSFEVAQGEVVGIIGRNGAGKSTLLKILSRITEPTQGRITLRGRVSSLLEVGTGFHPELTGRENVYLNGTILGMSGSEVRRKFDEIVAFAEVEKFLDTPVKHYSSGMQMRLAFAVAAHLEPEILVIDEVLAVGDAKFQSRCLGKMSEVSRSGRTILFVSHNMSAMRALCSRGLLLKEGRVDFNGTIADAATKYAESGDNELQLRIWPDDKAPGDETVRLRSVEVTQPGSDNTLGSGADILVVMEVDCFKLEEGLCIGFEFFSQEGGTLFWTYHTDPRESDWPVLKVGRNRLVCHLPANLLNSGVHSIAPRIGIHNRRWIVHVPPCLNFNVEMTHAVSPYWTSLASGRRLGQLAPILQWESK
jgi:homopolymeric O-antigen transport system ATP-binding protein